MLSERKTETCILIAALPTLDVNEGALDTIFSIYKQLLPEMGGYLIHYGRLQHQRLEILLGKLAELELETLEQRASVSSYCKCFRLEECCISSKPSGLTYLTRMYSNAISILSISTLH